MEPLPTRWPDAAHRAWLNAEGARLLAFGRPSLVPGEGFGWLDGAGRLELNRPVATWITARMTHVYALATLRGDAAGPAFVDHGLAALAGPLADQENGGWFESRADTERKAAYAHAFVVLAASSAHLALRPGAGELLDRALSVVQQRFLDREPGVTWESYDATWTTREPYRGANSAMHLVEALLAAADATEDGSWRRAALEIARDSVHELAPQHGWLIPEHRTVDGAVLLDFNADHKDDPFRPYGATPGHAFEWSRLFLSLEAAMTGAGEEPPSWLLTDARELFDTATRLGLAERAGFVYTVDWTGAPVVPARFHWVLAEAIAAAAVLYRRTGEPGYAERYAAWWDIARTFFIDEVGGSWWHELDELGRPAVSVWPGKPDVYHAYQATLIPLQPPAGSLAGALAIPPPL
jgi:mannose/cellobiose epimerase-like protein (N-acyl-D-glucosamine 2-epimerase family)